MPNQDPPALELRALTKRYDDGTAALDGFDLTVPDGAFFGLLGPNGAGKTTLISAVTNLIRVTAGEVLVVGARAAAGGVRLVRRAGREPRRTALDRPRGAGHQPRPLPHGRGDARLPRRL